MIFIGLFIFIALIFGILNFIDNSNIEKIEKYLNDNNCSEVVYIDGNYQALCEDRVMIVENQFSLELEKSKHIDIKDIKDLKTSNMRIIINDNFELKFKEKQKQENFYNTLKGSVK
jgi:uncharacterized protein with FMN-binding domain